MGKFEAVLPGKLKVPTCKAAGGREAASWKVLIMQFSYQAW